MRFTCLARNLVNGNVALGKREEKKKIRADDCDIQRTVEYDDFLNEASDKKISRQ